MRAALPVAVLLAAAAATAARPDPDLVVADFDGPDYAGWTATGTAFGTAPARGTLPNQMPVSGFKGKGLVNSFAGGDKSTGTLTSPPFRVERDYLNFLIGGGMHPGKTCANLLLDGKVVRTATGPNDRPGGSEELIAATWDVKEFRGKQVVVQLVDDHTGGWGHVNFDHLVQSDTKLAVEIVDRSRDVPLTKKYLLFPVSNAAKPVRMTVTVDGKKLHDFDINLAAEKADWWARLDFPAHAGQTATVAVKRVPATSKGLDLVEASDAIRFPQPAYAEALRPQLRFSQLQGWNNDPNGMVYHAGEWHLFWQSNPFGPQWANMYWGHAVSKDLVHWEELPYALYPRTMAKDHCFSGSAHIDELNTGGWQVGAEKTMVAAFTDTGTGEALAISNDRGRTWRVVPESPVIPKRASGEGRDPKLVWYAPGKHWVIAVYTEIAKKHHVEFYASADLRKWTKTGQIEGYYECPELFELPVDGDAKNSKWVLLAADARYAVGRFDGKTFVPDHPGRLQVHHGAFYAPQCFSRAPNGRVVQVGWARIDTPGMPFNQAFSLPIELTLTSTAHGVRLRAAPVKELETLRDKGETVTNAAVSPVQMLAVKAQGQLLDIVAEVAVGDAKEVRLQFGGNTLVYTVADQKLDGMPLPLRDGRFAVRVVVDRPMYEVIGGAGEVYKTAARRDAGRDIDAVQVSGVGGTARVTTLTVYGMRSIWGR